MFFWVNKKLFVIMIIKYSLELKGQFMSILSIKKNIFDAKNVLERKDYFPVHTFASSLLFSFDITVAIPSLNLSISSSWLTLFTETLHLFLFVLKGSSSRSAASLLFFHSLFFLFVPLATGLWCVLMWMLRPQGGMQSGHTRLFKAVPSRERMGKVGTCD